MSDLREIYQQVVLDHNKSPRNFRKIENANHHADGHNPLCGDRISVDVVLDNGVIEDVAFQGKGCAICTASASIMTQSLKGKPSEEAEALFERFHHMLTVEEDEDALDETAVPLGKLKAFAGVREFPVRVKCATLPWHTFHAALTEGDAEISTE